LTPSTSASATATVLTCTSMLLTSFMASPLPSGPTWKVWLPMTSNRSLHLATTAASPPTITDSSPDWARPVPPLTGASIMAMPLAGQRLGQRRGRERVDGRHADHDVAGLGALDDALAAGDHRLRLVVVSTIRMVRSVCDATSFADDATSAFSLRSSRIDVVHHQRRPAPMRLRAIGRPSRPSR
jgi:hypothetical protein